MIFERYKFCRFIIMSSFFIINVPAFGMLSSLVDPKAEAFIAAKGGRLRVLKLCLRLGAHIDECMGNGSSLLQVAAHNGQLKIVKFLVSRKADINNRNHRGRTPLHNAAINNHVLVATFLLQHGADINASDLDGMTPLTLALYEKNYEVAERLVFCGANVNMQDKTFLTPLHYVAWNGNKKMAMLLLDYGADATLRDMSGKTPEYLSSTPHMKELIKNFKVNRISAQILCLLCALHRRTGIKSPANRLTPDFCWEIYQLLKPATHSKP